MDVQTADFCFLALPQALLLINIVVLQFSIRQCELAVDQSFLHIPEYAPRGQEDTSLNPWKPTDLFQHTHAVLPSQLKLIDLINLSHDPSYRDPTFDGSVQIPKASNALQQSFIFFSSLCVSHSRSVLRTFRCERVIMCTGVDMFQLHFQPQSRPWPRFRTDPDLHGGHKHLFQESTSNTPHAYARQFELHVVI